MPLKISATAQLVAEAYAVIFPASPARTTMLKWINAWLRQQPQQAQLTNAEIRDAVEELRSAGRLTDNDTESHRTRNGLSAPQSDVVRLCVEACKRPYFASSLLETLDEEYDDYHDYFDAGYAKGHANLDQRVRINLLSGNTKFFKTIRPSDYNPGLWLTEPDAAPYFVHFPDNFLAVVSRALIFHSIHYVLDYRATWQNLLALDRPLEDAESLHAFGLVLRGELDEAQNIAERLVNNTELKKRIRTSSSAVLALINCLRGHNEAARQSIENTLNIERSGTRKRKVYPHSLALDYALLALVRSGTSDDLALLNELINIRERLEYGLDMSYVLMVAMRAGKQHTGLTDRYIPEPDNINSIMIALASRWHPDLYFEKKDKRFLRAVEALAHRASQQGYAWILAEAMAVLEHSTQSRKELLATTRKLFDEADANTRHQAMGTKSLLPIVKRLEPWEYSLNELEQLLPNASPNGASHGKTNRKRLAWRIDNPTAYDVEVVPIEQSLSKNGQWSKGRNVSLKRLRSEPNSIDYLTEQDLSAALTIQCIEEYRWGYGDSYAVNEETLYQLIDHPHVYDGDGRRVEVREAAPELQVSDSDGVFFLSIEPEFDGAPIETRFDPGSNTLFITRFTDEQQRIADLIGNKQLTIPEQGKERLQKLLMTLSGSINIAGDSQQAASDARDGNPEPLAELEYLDGNLSVRIRTQPLPESQTYFDAGSGGAMVFVQTDAGSVSVTRDLAKETALMRGLIADSAVLSQFDTGQNNLLIEGMEPTLEFLTEAREQGIKCTWPKGQTLKVAASTRTRQMTLNISSGTNWFEASGELRLDNSDDSLSLTAVLALLGLSPTSRFIELQDGQFLALSKSLHRQLRAMRAFTSSSDSHSNDDPDDKNNDTQTRFQPLALLALEPLLQEATVKGDQSWQKARKKIDEALSTRPAIPPTLEADLRSYQIEGYEWMMRLAALGAGACLADDMGLGKTLQALAVLLARAVDGPALVIAPTSVVGNWISEAQRFAPSLNVTNYAEHGSERQSVLDDLNPFDVVITSYGLMLNDIDHLEAVHWTTLVIDEAQAIKNANTRRARAARRLQADFRIATSGTPVQNNLMDLHSLFSFLNPGLLGSENTFRGRFAIPIERDKDAASREELQLLVAPFMLRRNKREVLTELPARTDITLSVELSPEEAHLYEALRQEALDAIRQTTDRDTPANMMMLAYLTKLRRLCCHPQLVLPNWTGNTSKLQLFNETLDELLSGEHKALVFSQFVDHLKLIEEQLISKGIRYQYLDGSTTAKQRTQRVAAFQAGEGDVFLISLTAGGTGLNLTAADYVIHLDPWWNPAVEDQASDRAHRMGQRRPVTIYRMITQGTIEEQIQTMHGNKRNLADTILSGSDSAKIDTDMLLELLQNSLD